MNWLVHVFGAAFVRKLGYVAAVAFFGLLAALFK